LSPPLLACTNNIVVSCPLRRTMLSAVARRYLVRPRTLGGAANCSRSLSISPIFYQQDKLRVAIIGQSLFGLEVYKHLLTLGHEVAGVFTIPGEFAFRMIWHAPRGNTPRVFKPQGSKRGSGRTW